MRCRSKDGLFVYVAATLAALLVSAPHSASGAALFWDGTNTSWNTNTAWSVLSNASTPDPVSPPGAGDVANFNITTVITPQTVNLNASQSAAGLIFSSSGTVLVQTGSGSNTLLLGANGITVNSGAGSDTITATVKLGNSQVWTNNSANTLTVSGIITGSGDVTKSGTGTVLLSNGLNSYTGTTSVGNGILLAGAAGAIPATALTVNSPGTFNMGGFAQGIGSLTGSGAVTTTGASGSDTLTIGSDNTSPAAFNGSINNAVGGRMVALAKVGTGTLTLGGSSNFSGGLTVNGGTLDLNFTTSLLSAAGNIFVASSPGQTATLTLEGKNGIIQTVSGALLSVGNGSTGAATLNIGTTASNAAITTGTGTLSIFSTGTVNIGNALFAGTLNANGNVTIDAGVLARSNGSSFNLATGKTMAIQNAGRASFTGNYDTANATYNITGTSSKLETISTGTNGDLRILNGGQVNVSLGGLLSSANILDVASTPGTGALSVDGTGSSVIVANSGSTWGNNGGTANVTFSASATGSFGATSLAAGSVANTAGTLNVQTGASVSFGNLLIADSGGTGVSGTVNINGAGSQVSQTGATLVIVGSNSTGTANINIGTTNTGGTLTTGTGLMTINKTGTVTIGNGANTGALNANGNVTIDDGALTLASGSTFALAAGRTMTIQNAGTATFSVNNYIPPTNAVYNVIGANSLWQFTGTNSLPIVNSSQVNVGSGGTLSTGGAINVASNGSAGTLSVDGSGSLALASGSNCIWGQNGGGANVTFSNSANGQFNQGVTLANGSTPGTTANVSVQSGATWTSTGNVQIGNSAGAGSSATLTVTGVGSSVTQNASSPLTVGTGGSGAVNGTLILANGGTWNSNGTTTIQARGLVDIQTPSSSLNANGNVVIDGGVLQVANGLSFNLSAGKTMTVQNGGRASITGGYSTATNAVYNVAGTGSKMENLAANSFNIAAGAQVNVTNGGLLTSLRNIDMANGGNGTLAVDGAASSISAGLTSTWGFAGATANATFSNNATANFVVLNLVAGSSPGASADVTFQTGADLSAVALNLNTQGGTTSGTLTVTDAGSSVTLNNGSNAAFSIGSSSGTATLNVNNNAAFAVLGNSSTTMNSTAVININGGSVALNTLTYNGGTINLNSGSLSYGGNLTVGLGGMMGQNLTIDSTKSLTLTGTTTIDAFHTLTVSGGTFNTGTLVANGAFNFTSGIVGITGAGGLTLGSGGALGSSLTLNSGTTLNVTNTTTINTGSSLSVGGGTFSTGFLSNAGNLVLNSGTLTINGGYSGGVGGLMVIGQNAIATVNSGSQNSGELQLGGAAATLAGTGTLINNALIRGDGVISKPLANTAGAEIRAEAGKRIKLTATNGTNTGKINLQSGTAEFTQALTNGGGAQPGEIIGRGTLIVGGPGLTNNGNVALSGGISDVFGDVNNSTGLANVGVSISGAANVTFWDEVTNGAGSLFKVSAGSTATFFGTYGGAGTSGTGQVNFEADVTPGFSPAAVSFGGNVALSTTAKLKIEIGGTTAGTQFDRVQVANQLSLDGTLDVSLINGFTPAAGNSFDILDWTTLSGTFSTLQLPALAGGLDWNTSQLYTTGTLSVGGVLGDYNHNGTVDAADYVVWRKTLGQLGAGLAADGNGNNQIDQGDFDTWRAHLGQTAGSGSNLTTAAVPEPVSTNLLIVAIGLAALRSGARSNTMRCRAHSGRFAV